MNANKEVIKILEEFNKIRLNYVLLRNYGFLEGGLPGKDIDIVIERADSGRIKKIFQEFGFRQQRICPYSNHLGFYKFFTEENKLVKFHFHLDGISGNHVIYLGSGKLFKNKRLAGKIPVISNEDTLVSLSLHSRLGREGRKEYSERVKEILGKDFDKRYVRESVENLLGRELSQSFLKLLYSQRFDELDSLRWKIKRKLFLKSILHASRIRISCILWKLKHLLRGAPVISFIGIDGAGKTTLSKKVAEILNNNKIKTTTIYTGRGKNNLLPIQKIGKPYKNLEKKININKFFTKIIYSFSSFLFFSDLLLRYFLIIYPAKLKNKIVITDRYSTDILLMKNIPNFLKNVFYFLLPKPDLIFYIYNDIKVLHQRKPDHPVEDLKRQEELFNRINEKINPIKIKNESLKDSESMILSEVFEKVKL